MPMGWGPLPHLWGWRRRRRVRVKVRVGVPFRTYGVRVRARVGVRARARVPSRTYGYRDGDVDDRGRHEHVRDVGVAEAEGRRL